MENVVFVAMYFSPYGSCAPEPLVEWRSESLNGSSHQYRDEPQKTLLPEVFQL